MTATALWQIHEGGVNSYNEKMPAFSLLWSATSQLAGLHPLLHIQLYLALVTSTIVAPAYLLGLKASGRRLVGVAAAAFLAVFGSFLFLTSAVMKESIGLVLFPTIVLLFHGRAEPRKRILAAVLLLFLPFLHQVTSLFAFGSVAALVVLGQRRAIAQGRFSVRSLVLDVATGPGPAAIAYAYYRAVDLPLLADVTSADALVILLAIIVFLTALMGSMWRPARVRAERGLGSPLSRVAIVPVLGIVLFLVHGQRPIFPGTAAARPALVEVIPALAVLAAFAVVGYALVRRTTNRTNDLVIAMLVPPVALALFGFLRGLDPLSHTIVYRSLDFLDYALALLAGIGVVALGNRLRGVPIGRAALGAGFVAALLSTTPIAWNTQAVFGVENVTTPEEFRALALLASLGAKNVTTDQRLADVGASWFGLSTDRSLPVRLRDGGALDRFDYAVVLERWTTVGAQIHPAPNVVVAGDDLYGFLDAHRVLFVAGSPGDRVYAVRLLYE